MSLFRTLAAAAFDGAAVTKVAGLIFSAIARTGGQVAGSWDLTLAQEIPTGKVIVRVVALNNSLTTDYVWIDTHTLRVTMRDNAATLTDGDFATYVRRCKA